MTGFNPYGNNQQPITKPVQETTHNNTIPPQNNNSDSQGMITKNLCAVEINKWLKKTKTLAMVAIIGYLVSAVGSIFGVMGSTILSIGFIGFSAWILASAQKEIKRLRDTYGIQ